MNMSKRMFKFDNSELSEKKGAMASASICGEEVIFAMNPLVADECGAELYVHELNDVVIYQTIRKLMDKTVKETYKPFKKWNLPIWAISHNLNAESNGEYSQERYLLHEYIECDKLSGIDHVWTIEETNFALMVAFPKMIFVHGAFPERFL